MRSFAVRCLSLTGALVLCALAAAWAPAARGSAIPAGFDESVVFSGLNEPTDVAFAADGRVFVAEKSGLIKSFASLSATAPTVAADLRTQVHNFWDRGLLGIALDPQFPARPYLYALYAYDAAIGGTAPRWGQPGATSDPCPSPPGATADGCLVSTRLSKLTLSGGTVSNEQVLINDWCQQYPSHSAGGIAFGPDGKLYASGGDGASFTFVDYGQDGSPTNPCGDPPVAVGGKQSPPTAQGGALRSQDLLTTADPTTLDGSLIRIDPDSGAAAPGNPLAASADANARRIVATGMRNPFRFAFRPGSSEIYVGDVGWEFWEEINRIPRADDASVDNFGWPCYEGNGRQAGYENAGLSLCNQLYANPGSVSAPLLAYHHTDPLNPGGNCDLGGASISGLAFYDGGNYPDAYDGALFFADYSKRCSWVMFVNGGQPDPQTTTGFLRDHDPVNLKIGPGGDLFVVDFSGSLRRVTYGDGNRAPHAVAKAEPHAGPLPLTVSFDASGSSDPDGDPLSYAWDLDGDGQYDDSTALKPSWQYTSAATVTARLRVTDPGGLSATDSIAIGAGNNIPEARIDAPSGTLRWAVGDSIAFSGGGSDPEDGALGPAALSWALVLRHCITVENCHSHPLESYPGVAGGSFVAPDHDYPSHLELRLTVTDKAGLSDTETLRLDPRTVELSFRTDPPGMALAVGTESALTPFTRTVIVGSRNSLSAPTPQALGGSWQGFVSWSDGGARSHEITAPAGASTYTATYQPQAAPAGLVAAFGFDETGGSAATDASPSKNNGTVISATSTAAGRYGRALSFDGNNDRVDVPDSASLDLTTAMTLEAWVKPTSNTGWRTAILKERGTGGHVYALYSSEGSAPIAENFVGSAYNGAPGLNPLPLDAWSHLAATYDGAALRLYVNGSQVGSKAVTGAMAATASPLRIGGNALWGEYFAGLIDEVRVYSRALSAEQIQTDMLAPIGVPVPTDTTPPSAPGNLTATGALGRVTLAWNASTDNVAVSGYEVYRSTSPGFTPAAGNRIATTASPGYADTVPAGTYHYRVKAADAAGNLSASSAEVSGTATADTVAPTVSLSAPTGGTVAGAVTLRASAADNVAVAGVQFLVDGAAFGAEDTAAPYEVEWPSAAVANGAHKLSARARDAAGNTTTSAEVSVTVDNPTAPAGLVAAYGFEETTGTQATDASASKNNGTVNGATRSSSGRFGRALSFDGTNDRVDVPDSASLDLTTAMTLEAWVRPSSNTGWRTAILKERGSGGHVYALYSSEGSVPIAESFVGSTYSSAAGPSALPLNAWTHLATTYDGAALRLFVNGNQVASKAVTGSMAATASPLRIGGNALWGEYFAGLIDEVRVYNRALTVAQIQADMNTPIGAPAPPDTTPPSAPGGLTATGALGKVTLAWTASTDDVGVSGYEVYRATSPGFTPAAGNRVAVTATPGYVDNVAAGTYHYRVRATDAAGNLSASSAEVSGTASAETGPPAGLVAGYGFDEASGTQATDASPAKNNGTVNGATRSTSGRFGRALSFDGTNDRVDVPDSASLDLTTAMTLEAWVRPSSNTGWRTAILKERGSGGHVYALYSSEGSAPIAESFVGSTYSSAAGPSALPLNAWTHLATTYDGAALRLFVNGNQVASKAVTGAMAATASPLRIGGNALWGEYFAGLIDEVRIYNRALTVAQIQTDMLSPVG